MPNLPAVPTAAATALLTGATGYLGWRLAQRLLDDGFAAHAVTRASTPAEELARIPAGVTIHRHDGSTDNLIAIATAAKPTVAFHLAGLFIAPHKPADVLPLLQSNIVFGTQLLEALTAEGTRGLVNVGTWWQHYHDEPYRPVALYAATRQAFQDIVDYYADATPMRAITLKVFDTYGEDDPRPKLLATLARAALEGTALDMSPGDQPVDYVHVDDVMDAFMLAGRRLIAGDVVGHEKYALATRKPVTIRQLVSLFEKESGRRLPINWGVRPHRPREMMQTCRAGEWLPAWQPKVELAEGIRRFLAERGPIPS
jgi:nucleoside-diphosphate-sugar epimerase